MNNKIGISYIYCVYLVIVIEIYLEYLRLATKNIDQ